MQAYTAAQQQIIDGLAPLAALLNVWTLYTPAQLVEGRAEIRRTLAWAARDADAALAEADRLARLAEAHDVEVAA
jgi:hypothetical protein